MRLVRANIDIRFDPGNHAQCNTSDLAAATMHMVKMSRYLAFLCAASQCVVMSALAEGRPAPVADYEAISVDTAKAVDTDDFVALEQIEAHLRTTRAMEANGVWGLRTFYSLVEWRLQGQKADLAGVMREEALLQRWLKACPDSLAAPVLLGSAYTEHAFLLRGGDYASKVTTAQWAGYRDYLRRANAAFSRNAKAQQANPAWYAARLRTATSDTMTPAEFIALLRESLALAPDYNEPLRAAVHYASPKWGGTAELLEEIGQAALKIAGPDAYTVLYSEAFRVTPCNCEYKAGELKIQWPVFDQGVQSRLEKLRGSYFVNMYAAIECNSGRTESRDALRPRLIEQGKRPEVWIEFQQKPDCLQWVNSVTPKLASN